MRETWRPVLEGEEARRALEAVSAISEVLPELPLSPRGGSGEAHYLELARPSVAGGEAGYALFYAYLDRHRPGEGFAERSLAHLDQAMELLASSEGLPGLYSGFTGVAWTVEHLRGHLVADDDDPVEEIDELLVDLLDQPGWNEEFDLTSGLVGYGLYALTRCPRPAAARCCELVVDRLADIAVEHGDGISWHTHGEHVGFDARDRYPRGYEDLGVAHGVAGVIAVLARVVAAGISTAKAQALLDGAVSWLLAQKLEPGSGSVFPYVVASEVPPRAARAAWCYGDPGIAATLLLAARAAGRSSWEQEALELARATARRPREDLGLQDACLCHGTAGLGHLFNRFYQATGEEIFRDHAAAWFRATLEMRKPDEGCAGYWTWGPDENGEMAWRAEPSFLTGVAGLGLTLLAAATPHEPCWDELLLASPTAFESSSQPR